ncbi:MAG: signal peptide peptidase SppA [bacterium]|jgi:protease-4|nr:signal peptide peptidase SppA [bacterium]
MRRLFSLLAFIIIFIVIIGNVIGWLGAKFSSSDKVVGVIKLYGEITTSDDGNSIFGDRWASADKVCKLIREARSDNDIAGVVVRVNSPGGTIAASQEIYDALKKLAKKKPVVVSMGDVGASGAYYISAAAHEIIVNPGTTTGSIGVIAMFANASGLFQKIGLDHSTVKSGKFKDLGNTARPMTEEERELVEKIIMDDYEQFIEAVIEGRQKAVKTLLEKRLKEADALEDVVESEEIDKIAEGKTAEDQAGAGVANEFVEEWIRSYADGRIFNGRQALEYGFADRLGNFRDAIRICGRKAGIKGKPDVVSLRTHRNLLDVLFEMSNRPVPFKLQLPSSLQIKFIMP